jgi:hypothetical protein
MKHGFAAGASASLNKTTTSIMKFLEDEEQRPPRHMRAFLYEKLGDLAEMWYRKGFNRGHKESDEQCEESRVPRVLRYDATREFFTNDERAVRLKSTLKKRRSKG